MICSLAGPELGVAQFFFRYIQCSAKASGQGIENSDKSEEVTLARKGSSNRGQGGEGRQDVDMIDGKGGWSHIYISATSHHIHPFIYIIIIIIINNITMDDIIDAMIIVIEHLCNSVIPPFFENTYL